MRSCPAFFVCAFGLLLCGTLTGCTSALGDADADGEEGGAPAGDCDEVAVGNDDQDVCLCAPYDVQGPPLALGSVSVGWATSIGSAGRDNVELVRATNRELVVVAGSSLTEKRDVMKLSESGELLWKLEVPTRGLEAAVAPDGRVVLMFEHVLSEDVTLGDTTLTEADRGATFITFVDGATGLVEDVVKLPTETGELWGDLVIDDAGLHYFRPGTSSHVSHYDFASGAISQIPVDVEDLLMRGRPGGGLWGVTAVDDTLFVRDLAVPEEAIAVDLVPNGGEFNHTRINITDMDVAPNGTVVVAGRLSVADEGSGLSTVEGFLVTVTASSEVSGVTLLPSAPVGVAFASDDEIIVWRALTAVNTEIAGLPTRGWVVESRDLAGLPTVLWALEARDDYAPYGTIGDMVFDGAGLAVGGAFVGAIDLGGVTVEAPGCTDNFIARLPL